MKKESITRNYIYNLLYQMMSVIAPLISTPYLSRVLSISDIGRYSYAKSISTYFILLGTIGINFYAQREIAVLQGNAEKQKVFFWEVILLRIITVTASIMLFLFFIVFGQPDAKLYLLLTIEIIAVTFDISWYYQGQERFSGILLCNTLIKVISILSIFIFVRSEKDLLVYAFIYSMTVFLNNASLWFLLPKGHFHISIYKLKYKKHIKPSLLLFIPQAAILIYTVLDKTMIGIITKSELQNGYYEQSYKIITIVLMIVTASSSVLLSRVAKMNHDNNHSLVKKYINSSIKFSLFLAIPMSVGIICTSREILKLFLGEQYVHANNILQTLSITVVFIGVSNVLGIQYLVALRRQREYTTSVIVGAIINIILNYFLIKNYGAFGAAIATVISEGAVVLVQVYLVRNEISMKFVFEHLWKYMIAVSGMVLLLMLIARLNMNSYITILCKVSLGAITYYLILYMLDEDVSKLIFYKFKSIFLKNKVVGGK